MFALAPSLLGSSKETAEYWPVVSEEKSSLHWIGSAKLLRGPDKNRCHNSQNTN